MNCPVGAKECSPGREPGATDCGTILSSGGAKDLRGRVLRPSGTVLVTSLCSPGLRPGLHSCAPPGQFIHSFIDRRYTRILWRKTMLRRSVILGLTIGLIGIVSAAVLNLAAADDVRVANAAMKGDKEAVRALLKQAADVNAAQGDGMTALH